MTEFFVFILLFMLTLIISQVLGFKSKKRGKYQFPPGPKGLLLIGNIFNINAPRLYSHKDLYGDLSYLNILGTNVVIINSAKLLRETFLRPNNLLNGRPKSFFEKYVFPDDVGWRSPSAPYWEDLHRIMMTQLKMYGRGVAELEDVVVSELEHLETAIIQKNDSSFDLHELLKPSICNIMYILTIGCRFPYNDKMNTTALRFVELFSYIAMPVNERLLTLFPFIRFVPCNLGQTTRQVISDRNTIFSFIHNYVKNSTKIQTDSLEEVKMSGFAFDLINNNEHQLDIKYIRAAINDMFSAGIITTSTALYQFFLTMIHYPRVQDKVYQEIMQTIGQKNPKLSDKSAMPYTQAAILESIRYSSIVPFSIHTCEENAYIGENFLPKDTIILFNFFRMQHDPDNWINPWVFDPDRFLTESGLIRLSSDPIYKNMLQFGVGERVCPGKMFAKNRMFLYITRLIQKFEFFPGDALSSCDPRELISGLVSRPEKYTVKIKMR